MRFISVVQHCEAEWLGHIEDHLEGRGLRFGYFRPFAAAGTLPKIETLGDGLILLGGGPWGAASKDRLLPTLEQEVRLARACLMLGKPVLGFGLGSQILALAAEGRAEAAATFVGVIEAHRERQEALEGLLPAVTPLVVYMRDRPVPPDYAVVLARSPEGEPVIYQVGPTAFGFHGNIGARPAMIEELVMADDTAPANSAEALTAIRLASSRVEDALVAMMTGLVSAAGWMR